MATRIVTVLQQKGGVGKTTIAVQLATMIKHLYPELKVAVADADDQNSASMWLGKGATEVPCVKVARETDAGNLKQELLSIDADLVILDLPPQVYAAAAKGVMHASLVLIPIGPSELETDAARRPMQLVEEMQSIRPDLKVLLIPNRVRHNTSSSRELRPALEQWGKVSRATIHLLTHLSDSVSAGVGVDMYSGAGHPAYEAIKDLSIEVLECLDMVEEGSHE